MKNTKIKQRKCPFGKVELCDSYGNCGDCTWHKVIEKYEKRIAKLKEEHEELDLEYKQAMSYIDGLEYEKRQIENQSMQVLQMLDDLENKQNEVTKQTAKELLEIVADKISCDHVAMRQYDWFKELASKYGIEVE